MAGSASLLIASNRGPLSVVPVDRGDDEIRRGGGGLVSGMQGALAKSQGAIWVCAAMNDRERLLARQTPGGLLSNNSQAAEALAGEFDVLMLPIDAQTFRMAYNGIANSTLWFVLHLLFEPARSPVFDQRWRRQWGAYQRYNWAFAQALAEAAAENATVMVQDYHLFLVPRMLRELRPDLHIGHFTHTPWAPPDYFRMLPDDVSHDILYGMLGADVLGFHTDDWAREFSECCSELLGESPKSQVSVFPLGVEADELKTRASQRDVEAKYRELSSVVGDCLVIGRVDRTELSKNVYRGLLAYREMLRAHRELHGEVCHVVFNYPSREDLPEYREYTAAVERLGREIDDEFSTDEWTPLILEIADDYPGSLAAMRVSDVMLVNSVRDGMNLVVLEGIILSERDAIPVLSREAGAAHTLGDDALLVNPFDVSHTAAAMYQALTMERDERAARSRRMRAAATRLPPGPWFDAQLESLER